MSEPTSYRAGHPGWSRGRLLGVLVGGVIAAALAVTGLGYAVVRAIGGDASSTVPHSATTQAWTGAAEIPGEALTPQERGVRRDRIAAAPMLRVAPVDSRPGPLTTKAFPGLEVPLASDPGSAGVTTGYPHTPAGAVGQLAALEVRVLEAMSLEVTSGVYDVWTLPNPQSSSAQWALTGNVRAFLAATGSGTTADATTTVTATPAAGLVKGTDGVDWVLACVLLEVRAIVTIEARIGYGHCERMQWVPRTTAAHEDTGAAAPGAGPANGRWMIAPGTPPATAPSTWPGTEVAHRAGWRSWHWSEPRTHPDSGLDSVQGLGQ